jgi:hypothetical protein
MKIALATSLEAKSLLRAKKPLTASQNDSHPRGQNRMPCHLRNNIGKILLRIDLVTSSAVNLREESHPNHYPKA